MFDISYTDPSWQPILQLALSKMDQVYLAEIERENAFLPDAGQLFNAFRLPVGSVNYVLFGESPYPRKESANGYSFWDQMVTSIWSSKGLSTDVNRATSLRNIFKLLLVSGKYLDQSDTSQESISKLDKESLVSTLDELFNNMINKGFLLLNATLILRDGKKNHDAKQWLPFIETVLSELYKIRPSAQLVLFGKIAEKIQKLPASEQFEQLVCEHPYNISFIKNADVQAFFRPLELLSC